MTFHEYRRVTRFEDELEERPHVTTAEKMADNVTLLLAARFAMVATPIVASILVWFGSQWLDQRFEKLTDALAAISQRAATLESSATLQDRALLELRGRADNGREARERLTADTKQNFDKIGDTLNKVNDRIDTLNGNVIRLDTTIKTKFPQIDGLAIQPRNG